ncbi:DegV family protein [Galactobacter valiniphilus]|uniref:DegV family protein n=1 Tax=Galactobacter valiniphilus TaxID=2676122 RepID=A0A399JG20_9MICC|nr:DegV family protein [Galactobacter valiniphilus]RII43149.1 DegV family protein [Galactobacter valiniphilus]
MREGESAPGGGLWNELRTRLSRGPRLRLPGQRPEQRVHVITDTASALPEGYASEHAGALSVVPMPVTVDAQVFIEGVDDVMSELSLGLAMGSKITTSRPAPGQLLRAVERAAEAGASSVLIVCISSALSGTVEAARWAAEQAELPVRVLDTRSVGLGEGFAVMAAVEAAEAGLELDEVHLAAASACDASVWFVVPSLEQLRRGGRIGTVASVLGTLLNVKPILTVNRDGAIVAADKARSLQRALAHVIELGIDAAGEDPATVLVGLHHFGAEEEAEAVAEALAPYTERPVIVTPVPAVLAAHTGAGVVALIVRRERA